MTRLLTAHEFVVLAPTLPGSEVRVFFEPDSMAVQILFVGVMTAHDLDPWELGMVYRLAPALDGRYEPARLVDYPEFRWQTPIAYAFGDRLGEAIRRWAAEAYEAHLSDQEFFLQHRLRRPSVRNGAELLRAIERIRETRRAFRERVGLV